jgi:hypothetical protein
VRQNQNLRHVHPASRAVDGKGDYLLCLHQQILFQAIAMIIKDYFKLAEAFDGAFSNNSEEDAEMAALISSELQDDYTPSVTNKLQNRWAAIQNSQAYKSVHSHPSADNTKVYSTSLMDGELVIRARVLLGASVETIATHLAQWEKHGHNIGRSGSERLEQQPVCPWMTQ